VSCRDLRGDISGKNSGTRGDDRQASNLGFPLGRGQRRRRAKEFTRLESPSCEQRGVLPSLKCSRSDVSGKDMISTSGERGARLVELNDRTMARASDGLVLPKHRERGASRCERITIVVRGGQPHTQWPTPPS